MKSTYVLVIGCFVTVSLSLCVALKYGSTISIADTSAEISASNSKTVEQGGGSRKEELRDRPGKDAGVRLQELADQVESLRQEVAKLDVQVRQLAAADSTRASQEVPLDSSFDTEADLELMDQEQEQRDREREAETETQFQSESLDREWSPIAAELIEQTLASEGLTNTEVYTTDCRSTTCRLEVEHADAEAADQFSVEFPTQVADALPQITYYQKQREDGRISTVLYLTRENHDPLDMAP